MLAQLTGVVMGAVIMWIGVLAMFGVWLFTTYVFFATGEIVLALISLLIPPADLVLPFLISPTLGFIGLGSVAVAFVGSALSRD